MQTKELLALTDLDILARQHVGDGQAPNRFFVSADNHVLTFTSDFETAYDQWLKIARDDRSRMPMLEDRVHGVLASIEKGEDTGTLYACDDTIQFGLRPPLRRKKKI